MGRSGFVAVCLTVFVNTVGLTTLLVGLPFRALELGAGGLAVGALATCYSLGQLLCAPLLGAFSDRRGRRPTLLFCLAGSAVAAVLTGLAPDLVTLTAARLLAGACAGSVAIAYAAAADATPPQQLTRAMSLLGASIGAAFVVGPALGAAFAGAGFTAGALVAAGVAALSFVFALAAVPETRPASTDSPPRSRWRRPSAAALNAVGGRAGVPLLLAGLFATLAFTAVEATLAIFAAERFAMTPRGVGVLLAVAGAVMVAVQAVGVHPFAERWGAGAVATAGMVTMAAALLTVPIVPAAGLVVTLAVLCAGYGMVTPTVATMLSENTGTTSRGRALGANQAATSLARITGPLAAGAAFDVAHPVPYVLAAGSALVGGALITVRSRKPHQSVR